MICGEIICLINQKMTVVLKITLPKNGFAFIAGTYRAVKGARLRDCFLTLFRYTDNTEVHGRTP
jgi:hypothetical protein